MDYDTVMPRTTENYVMFGDGFFAGLVFTTEDGSNGKRVFKVIPNEWLKYTHRITNSAPSYDKNNNYHILHYAISDCIPLNITPFRNIWLVLKDWNGNNTYMDTFFATELRKKLGHYMAKCRMLEAENFRLRDMVMKAIKYPEQIERSFLDRMERARKVVAPIHIEGARASPLDYGVQEEPR